MTSMPPTTPPPPPSGGSFTPPPPPPSMGGPASSDRTVMIVLSYLWLLALIPLLTKKDDPEVQWHAKNGLALMGAEVIFYIVFNIVGYFLPGVAGCGLGVLGCVVGIGILALHVMCIVKGINNQRFRVPVISDFADKM